MSQYKQAIVLREDIDMSTGKMIAQACHASLKAYRKCPGDKVREWESQGEKKIVLGTGGSIKDIYTEAERKEVTAVMVEDAGLTELEPGTVTAVGIGPDMEKRIDSITGDLKLIE